MKALPIGSVVKARGIKLLILGYQTFEQEDHIRMGYLAVKYPRGYAGRESLGILGFDEITEVLAEGRRTERETKYTEGLGRFADNCKELNVDEWELYVRKLQEKIHEWQ